MARRRRKEVEAIPAVDVEELASVETPVEEVPIEETSSQAKLLKQRIIANSKKYQKEYFDNSTCRFEDSGPWQDRYARFLSQFTSLEGKDVIDIGGAMGAITRAIKTVGKANRAVCADISKYATSQALFTKDGVEYLTIPAQYMKEIADETFDVVHMGHLLECIEPEDYARCLKEAYRILKKGGMFVSVETKNIKVNEILNDLNISQDITLTTNYDPTGFKFNWKVVAYQKN